MKSVTFRTTAIVYKQISYRGQCLVGILEKHAWEESHFNVNYSELSCRRPTLVQGKVVAYRGWENQQNKPNPQSNM